MLKSVPGTNQYYTVSLGATFLAKGNNAVYVLRLRFLFVNDAQMFMTALLCYVWIQPINNTDNEGKIATKPVTQVPRKYLVFIAVALNYVLLHWLYS